MMLLAAIVIRSLLADGYMPDEGGSVRLCTPEGMVTVVIDPETGEPVEVDETNSAECPWASVLFPAALLAQLPAVHPQHDRASILLAAQAYRPASPALSLPPARASPRLLC
ncbi:MAG: hypothetical protein U5L08_03390 [Xanthomonadales bacterium]|nr:hypothetical protein [Xanthomonadales bacterium]